MSDSNTVSPVAPSTLTAVPPAVEPVSAGQPGAPAPAAPVAPAAPAPVSYKDLLLEAHQLGKQNNQNIFRTAVLMEELTLKLKKVESNISDMRQQLAAICLLSDENKPITSTSAATKIVEEQTKALRSQVTGSLKAGMIAAEDTIKKITDIIWYSFEDGGLGYQSVAALPADQQALAIG